MSAIIWFGLSLRMRGTLPTGLAHAESQRFIPACAGNTGSSSNCTSDQPVYPCVCGEHPTAFSFGNARVGLSLRVRGTQSLSCEFCLRLRFIPACAGNTPLAHRSYLSAPVYPCVCGEHSSFANWALCFHGLSLRVRGTLVPYSFVPLHHRFIPACAGNTL